MLTVTEKHRAINDDFIGAVLSRILPLQEPAAAVGGSTHALYLLANHRADFIVVVPGQLLQGLDTPGVT